MSEDARPMGVYLLARAAVTLEGNLPSPRPGCAAIPATWLGRRPRPRDRPRGGPRDERRHAHPLGHRAGRPQGKRATAAPGLRGAAQARGPEAGAGETRPNTP